MPPPETAFIMAYQDRGDTRGIFVPLGSGVNSYYYLGVHTRQTSTAPVPPPYRGIRHRPRPVRNRTLMVEDFDPGVRRNVELNFLFDQSLRPLGVAFADDAGRAAFPKITVEPFEPHGPQSMYKWPRLRLTHVPAPIDGDPALRRYEGFLIYYDRIAQAVGMFDFAVHSNWGRLGAPAVPTNLQSTNA